MKIRSIYSVDKQNSPALKQNPLILKNITCNINKLHILLLDATVILNFLYKTSGYTVWKRGEEHYNFLVISFQNRGFPPENKNNALGE